jgi:hypothetical protein
VVPDYLVIPRCDHHIQQQNWPSRVREEDGKKILSWQKAWSTGAPLPPKKAQYGGAGSAPEGPDLLQSGASWGTCFLTLLPPGEVSHSDVGHNEPAISTSMLT